MSAKAGPTRALFTIRSDAGAWVVEHDGRRLDTTSTQEEARAAANKHARQAQDDGRPCQVRVIGEAGFFMEA
ncbi:MAG TPA: DUF2188 domain-containing protein [Caulobacteraceae bacterium]|nr:DUF2188 domain-containing protein [Caulobacteraceae bacterium]